MAVKDNSTNFSRRGFLSSLVAIPYIGGGLKLFGAPTAAALPVSAELLRRYCVFLGREQQAARVELELVRSPWFFEREGYSLTDAETWRRAAWWMEIPADSTVEELVTRSPSSSRAAVVMAAAGMRAGALRPSIV